MDWTDPSTAVMSRGAAAVLRALAGTNYAISVRELARLAGVSPTRARQVTEQLTEHGLLKVEAAKGSHLVRLNRRHLAVEPALMLATLRGRVLDQLREEFSAWAIPAVHVSLYGSAARGDGDTKSDLDFLVVRDDRAVGQEWEEQVATTSASIQDWTGNWVSWFEIPPESLDRMSEQREPIVKEWLREAITLSGVPLSDLLRRRS